MDSVPMLSMAELNAKALDKFVYQPVDTDMILYLADAAANVIQCDTSMMPPPAQSRSRTTSQEPSARAVKDSDARLPSIEEFITQLVISSNVQVPTLMSSLVYLRRLKSRLQPMAKGLRCTTHRIFLAALILSAKYLNDCSPKNKHWANYSFVSTSAYNFGFSRTEVNLMEKQLLFLLDWDLRITEDDLYRELDHFLAPIRDAVQDRHVRRIMRKHELETRERYLQEERLARQREREEEARLWRSLAVPQHPQQPEEPYAQPDYASPSSSRGSSHSRGASASSSSSRAVSPPGLYSSSGSSYSESTSSRATTPLSEADITSAHQPYVFESPVNIGGDGAHGDEDVDVEVVDAEDDLDVYGRPSVPEKDAVYLRAAKPAKQQMLPYEISAEELRSLEESGRVGGGGVAGKKIRGVFGRVFGTAR
ncbi:hypothetical protein CHGG_09293 [Chaetomium globosum CBS 148.51]|uniref:Cyclin N-terminal domain-containing protein n=1 Tax=Chaetomium globosum (strain ATCC 6205 / CBS 148.51 / DSM 1962 / NBRC 6347 / NRRL 1970) TaxID=306901 RepID=Q2GRW1_CHAGB|nr:uncharacterized protein CHGG_09293 [Chaetomium globosum CBS 148.51]EAQ85279.1 hypothetical protein CHGG_09293 [Chaetomium globosum CBS 148.51]